MAGNNIFSLDPRLIENMSAVFTGRSPYLCPVIAQAITWITRLVITVPESIIANPLWMPRWKQLDKFLFGDIGIHQAGQRILIDQTVTGLVDTTTGMRRPDICASRLHQLRFEVHGQLPFDLEIPAERRSNINGFVTTIEKARGIQNKVLKNGRCEVVLDILVEREDGGGEWRSFRLGGGATV